jgi:hypothetical protein
MQDAVKSGIIEMRVSLAPHFIMQGHQLTNSIACHQARFDEAEVQANEIWRHLRRKMPRKG